MFCKASQVLVVVFLSFKVAVGRASQMALLASEPEPVPGVNNATFCTVPRSEQLFHVNFFDIAPLPIPVQQNSFTYLRGWLPDDLTSLEDAELRVTTSAQLASGEKLEPVTYSIPLATYAADNVAHLTVRYPGGKFGGPLQTGVNEIVTDYWFPAMFVKAGEWTFKVEAVLPVKAQDQRQRYLFCFRMSQWLEP